MKKEEIKKVVRDGYARIAIQGSSCCGPAQSCCGTIDTAQISKKIGYSEDELNVVPEGANLGLGCGNPVALASLKEGEIVLDLGSGAGFDCFLAAQRVGKEGKVIGVDMTPEMIKRARENAQKGGYENVEFRLGEIENLPIADNYIDVIISNCVINLSPDKDRVFAEAFRVLKPGGRLIVSDIVLIEELPESTKNSISAYIGCLAGAVMKDEYISAIKNAGFKEVRIIGESDFPVGLMADDSKSDKDKKILDSIVSIKVYGIKPSVNS